MLSQQLRSTTYLEFAFLRWVLDPAVTPSIAQFVKAQREVVSDGHHYLLDYAIETSTLRLAVELDGFEFHGNRRAFTYDRLRQNDLESGGWRVLRFSYDAIRTETGRCIEQLQSMLRHDAELAGYLIASPIVEKPDMPTDAIHSVDPSPTEPARLPRVWTLGPLCAQSPLETPSLRGFAS